MTLKDKNIGFCFTGSFCTYDTALKQMQNLVDLGANIHPIFSDRGSSYDTRFGKIEDFLKRAEEISGRKPTNSIVDTEKYGPSNLLDIVVIVPCTGNSLAKLANGITDSAVLMTAKGHIRNNKPLLLAIATNDALGANMKNIGLLMNAKNIFFVPYGQDNYKGKPNSMVSDFSLLPEAIKEALDYKQLQPVIIAPK